MPRRKRKIKDPLVTDSDRKRRISICLKILKMYERMGQQFGNTDWVGHSHPYMERLEIHNYAIEWQLHNKAHVDQLRKNCEHTRSQLGIAEELDKEED